MGEFATQAEIAWQDELWIGRKSGSTTTWTQILGIETLDMPERVPEDHDATHMQSPGRTKETIPGLMDSATWTQEKQLWGSHQGDVLLNDLATITATADEPEHVEIEFKVGGIRRTYRGYVNFYTPAASIGEKRMVSLSLKIFEPITPNPRIPADGVAPVNTVPPHIIGLAKVGEVLSAWPGIWSDSSAALTYVWKADASPIAGQTGSTVPLVAAQQGKVITVEVTATNAAGSDTVTSAATATVTS